METTLRHRDAADRDIATLHELYSSPEVAPYMGFDPMAREPFRERLGAWRSAGPVRVVEDDAGLVGAYRLELRTHRMSGVVYFATFAVDPKRRGRGLGSRILRDVIDQVRRDGARRVELLVASDNPPAIALFLRHGFVHEGTMRAFFRRAGSDVCVDEHVMGLVFDAPLAPQQNARIVRRDEFVHYAWGDGCDGWKLVASPALSVIEERMPPGAAEVRHHHLLSRQLFYVLRGALVIECAAETFHLREREGLEVPPGVVHQVRNEGSTDAEFLVVSQPPSHGDRHQSRDWPQRLG